MSSSNKVTLAKLCKQHYHILHSANHIHRCLSSRCLSSVFTTISTRKAKQSIAFGLLLLASIFTTPLSAQTVVNICDRTSQVESAILAAITGTPACSAVTESQLATITSLDLRFDGITALQSGDFSGLSGLISLDLAGNDLSALPAGIFDDLRSLESLFLGYDDFSNNSNNLSTLPAGVFDNLTSLTDLDLSGNFLSALPAGVFDNLTSLAVLDLWFNQLTTLPAGIFDNLTSLTVLMLNENRLSVLPAGVFDNLTSLTVLHLGSNGLTTLPAGVFDSLVSLESLLLGYDFSSNSSNSNNLSTLPAGVFNNLTSLTELDLGSNGLTTLPAGVFGSLTSLTVLMLNENRLSVLPAGVFDNLTSLTELHLWSNDLSALPAGVFDNLMNLAELYFSDNDLSALPAGVFDNLMSLTYLDLRDNTFTTPLPADIFDSVSSANIIIDLSPIGDLPDVVLSIGGTTTINVANAFIFRDDEYDSGERSLTYTVTSDVTTIATASVSGAVVTIVAANVSGGVTDVTITRLERDLIEFESSGIQTATQTVTVTVEAVMGICDRTDEVEAAILAAIPANPACDAVQATDLANITELNLSNSNITSVQSGDFANLASLATLFLNDNNLSALPANLFSGLTSLGTLCLQGNTFTTALPADLFSDLPNTAVIEIDLSPIDILTDVVLSAGDMATIDLSEAFISRDPAGIDRPITYSVTSTDSAIATAEVSDAAVTINAAGTGNATVSVTASDSVSGLKGMLTRDIAVTVAVGICDRTDAVERAILDSIPANPTCDAVTETQLASITELYLDEISLNDRRIRITALQSGDFAGLTGLIELSLAGNSISTLPDDIFDNLTSLAVLDLCFNQLTTLPAGIFDNLTSLTDLDLFGNFLSALPDNIFDNLTNLAELYLWSNNLSTLPAGIFDNLTSLTELDLRSNNLSTLPAGIFDNLTSLTVLDLGSNNLSALPDNIFDNLMSLVVLDLYFNQLTTLPAGIFDNLTSLTDLDLSSNFLSALPAGIFDNLTSLAVLDLCFNQLTTLPAGIFDNLMSLTDLDLFGNFLSALPANLFDPVSSAVITIDLSPIGDLTGVALTVGGTTTINVTNAFISRDDFGNDRTLSYTTIPANTAVATVTESSGVVTITGAGMGTTTVSVIAEDNNFLSNNMLTRDIVVTVIETGILAFDEAAGDTAPTLVAAENGGTDTFYVQLASQPAASSIVTISVTSSATGEGTVRPAGLAFSATNWNTRQALTVAAVDDNIDRDGDSFMVDFEIMSGDGGNYTSSLMLPSVTVNITDDDSAGIALFDAATGDTLATPVAAENGGTDTFYVELASAPASDVTLTLTSSDTDEGTVSPPTLTFTAAAGATSWDTRQALTVTAVPDQIDRDDSFMVDFSITTGDGSTYVDSLDLPSVPVMISDDDVTSTNITLTVSPETVAETAGETPITVTATLDGAALTTAATVRVSVGSATDTAVEGTDYAQVTYYTLTIPALMTSGTGTFMLDPTDDTVDDDGETVTISGTSTGFTTASATLTIGESGILAFDEATGDAIATPVAVENSGTDMVYVQLASQPATNVVIEVTSSDTTEGTVSPPTLTFTAAGGATPWNMRQALTVTAVPDNIVRDDSFMVDFAITTGDGGNYPTSLTIPSVTVTVADDDVAGIDGYDMATGGSEISAITTSEAGGAVTTYVELTSGPTGTVTVTIDGIDAGEHTLTAPASGILTFDSTNWNTPRQAITITGVDDNVVNGDQMYDITLTATGGGYDGVVETVSLTNTDDDTAALSIADTTVDEDAGTATLTVTLTPAVTAGTVEVDLTTADGTATAGTDYTAITSETLTFTAGTTSVTQDITISDDTIDEVDETFTIMLDNLVPPTGITTVSITDATAIVTITDDDVTPTMITLSVSQSTIADTADATEITVTATLDGTVVLPTDTVVTVSVGDSGDSATEGTDYAIVPDFDLTIPALMTSAMGTFTIDPNTSSTNGETITIDGTSGTFTFTSATLTIIEAGISVYESQTSTAQISTAMITEASSDTFYVELASAPAGNVTLSVESSAAGEGTVTPSTLTFTGTNWNSRQALTVTAVPDNIDRDGDSFMVDFEIMSGDGANYPTSLTLPSVAVTITDDDTASGTINLSISPPTVAETAASTEITVTATIDGTVVLPTDTVVTVSVGSGTDTATEGTDYATVGDFTLTILAGMPSGAQTFMIDPTEDATDDNNEVVTIGGTATGFTTVNAATLTIVEAGISVFNALTGGTEINTATIDEASSDILYVQLASEPAASSSVTISVTSSATGEGTVRPATLTFTDTNWNTRQALTVTAVPDNVDRDGDSFMVDFEIMSGDGGNYTSSLTLPSVAVTVTDDDAASDMINLSISPLTVAETAGETTITVTAALSGATSTISTNVTIIVGNIDDTADEGSDYMEIPDFILTIPALMTSSSETFTITPIADNENDNEETITISGTATGFSTINSATLTITGFSEAEQQVIEQTVAAQASSVTQVVSENIGSFLASRTSAPPAAPAPPAPDGGGGGDINRENFTSIDWQDWQHRFAKLAYEGLKRLDSDADMSLDWALKAAGGDGRLLMPLGVESLTLWAAGGRLKTKGDGMGEYDGGVNSFVVGVDTNLINNWLLGIAASYSDSQVDYTMDGNPIGSNEQNLFSVHPFLSHSLPDHGLTLWVTGGYGVGDIDFSHTTNGEATSDVTQWMAAGGIEKHIITNTLWQGALRLKGLWGNATVDATEYDNGVDIRKVESTFWRARMESEMGYNFQLPGANVRPYALIGGRWDHNDAIVSGDEWHIDIGGGVEVLSGNAFALNISVHTQVTDGDTEEDSIIGTGSLTYDIGHDRQGLQITLSRPLNNTSPSWDQHSFNEVTDKVSGVNSAPLTSELAYGWTVRPWGLKGALQTYVQNSFDSSERHYAVGLELAVNALTLNFESGYHDHASLNSGEIDNTGLESMLKTKIRW